MNPRILFHVALLAAVCSQSGCRRNDMPEVGDVTGTIMLDQKPLWGAWVMFYPDQGRVSGAVTNKEGRYELLYLKDVKGAKVGHHTVRISTLHVDPSEADPAARAGERVPLIYNEKSTLQGNVEPGKNVIDFALQSKKP